MAFDILLRDHGSGFNVGLSSGLADPTPLDTSTISEVFQWVMSSNLSTNVTTSETVPKSLSTNMVDENVINSETFEKSFNIYPSENLSSLEIYSYTLFNAPWTLVYRNVKGSPLTFVEMDGNFTNLNYYKITKEENSMITGSTITPTIGNYLVTALSEAAVVNAPSGTPKDGQTMLLKIKDNGTARALSWNAIYRAMAEALPTTTTPGTITMVGFIYNGADSKWDSVL